MDAFRVKSLPLNALLLAACLSFVSCESGYFWHVTDMHWDHTYSQDTAAGSCNSDDPDGYYGPFGNFLCDSPWTLINSSVYAMREIHEDVEFLIWTGDDTPHIYDDDFLNQEVVWDIISDLTDKLEEVFPDHIIYSALGNHDWSPKNQLPPGPDPLYERIADKWAQVGWLVDPDANATFRNGGYYSQKHEGSNLRMMVLNTNLHYESNELVTQIEDPAAQFEWLEQELVKASEASEKVMVVAHVPPGMFEKHPDKHWFYPQFNARLLDILTRHAPAVGSMHYAHHHTDSFRVLYDGAEPVSGLLLGPAVTPWETTLPGVMGGTGNNPSIRLVQYDKQTGEVEDIFQYWLNLTAANQGSVRWELEYRATQYYGVPDMRAASLHALAERLLTENETFSRYYAANGVLYDPEERWTAEARVVHYCAITELGYEGYSECYRSRVSAGSAVWAGLGVILAGLALTLHCS